MKRTAADCRRDRLARGDPLPQEIKRSRRVPIIVRRRKERSFDPKAKEKFRKRFEKIAVQAIAEFDYRTEEFWLARCREAWNWEWSSHKIRLQKERSLYNPQIQAAREQQKAEVRWNAQLKERDHQEKLAEARAARRWEKEHGKEDLEKWVARQKECLPRKGSKLS
jgi:hypothetical protein